MTTSSGEEFGFRFDHRYRMAARLFGVTDRRAKVLVTDRVIIACFGPWTVQTPLTNIRAATITGPFHVLRTIGPARWSLSDHGLTFATNGETGVCMEFSEPVTGLDPLRVFHHPNLTVTVADPPGLVKVLARSVRPPKGGGG